MFQGAMVAIVTPFKAGQVDEGTFRDLIEFQIANGTHGIVPCGTTGESATLSFNEHERVIEIAVEQVDKRVPVIAGTGSNNTEEAIRLTKHAKSAGADGALLISPYYNKPTQEGLYRHYEKIAKAVDIPLVPYNIPGRTAVNMEPDTIARLAKIDNIVAIKEATGSMKQITDIIARCGDELVVLSGEDFLTFPLLCVGGKGVISVVSNIAPADMANLCNLFLGGDFDAARKLYYRLLPLCHGLFYETNPAPVKAALAMMNKIPSDELRLPLAPMSPANRLRLRQDLQAYGLI
ncbi:MAG TPA: 4-hydroxy-tetrahydrodipicolinate synthase [Syntrophobacter fumaroxidans]|nr:4-hydroxy-tetrahydrodipicolinate synthase [Syntrophobacter fumaroxidans]